MLLPIWVRWALIGVGLLGAVLGIAVWRDRRNRPASKVAEARVVGGRAATVRALATWGPIAVIPLGLALAYWAYGHDIEYLIVSDGAGGEPEVARRMGSDREPEDVPLAPGVKQNRDSYFDPTWVINRSKVLVRVESVSYGRSLGWGPDEPDLIPPGTAAHFTEIEHVGPGDPPPSSVTDDTGIGMDFRNWLTWGP
jgi:hypothetical protein